MNTKCPTCGGVVGRMWGVYFCRPCKWRSNTPPPDPDDAPKDDVEQASPLAPIARIHWSRVIEYKGFAFINRRALEGYEDYYDHSVGDIIAVMARSGPESLFFELAAEVAAADETDNERGYMLIRIDPETEFDKLPVLDVNPEDATLLGQEEEGQGSDEAR